MKRRKSRTWTCPFLYPTSRWFNPAVLKLLLTDTARNLPQDADPVDAPNGIKVKRKPAKSPAVLTNGTNGEVSRPSEQLTGKRKRDTDEVVETYLNYEAKKKRGTAVAEIAIRGVSSATPFLIDESNEGAIVLDDT